MGSRLFQKHSNRLKPVAFLHIQKTAGSSLLSIARQFYGADLVSHGDCWNQPPEKFINTRFVSGHIGYDYLRRLMNGRYSFTFLRDPIDRILSLYYFCKNRDPSEFQIYKRANELDLVQFLTAGFTDIWVKKNIWNNHVWQLAHGYAHLDDRTINDFGETELLEMATEHIGLLDYVGFTESFDTDSQNILRSLGLKNTQEIPRINQTQDRPDQWEISSKAKSLLLELTSLDRKFYAESKIKYFDRPKQ